MLKNFYLNKNNKSGRHFLSSSVYSLFHLIWHYCNDQTYSNKIKDILWLFIHRKLLQRFGTKKLFFQSWCMRRPNLVEEYHNRTFRQFSKTVYFQLTFLENCVYKIQKKSIKDQRNFCSNMLFKVFANSGVLIQRYDVHPSLTSRMV